ncbi:MAG: hypothetical protein AAB075_05325 [Gemmatimonadota bacterium]
MRESLKAWGAGGSAVAAAFASLLCCAGPLLPLDPLQHVDAILVLGVQLH